MQVNQPYTNRSFCCYPKNNLILYRFKKWLSTGLVMGSISVTFSGCTGEMTGQLMGGSMGALIGSQIGKGNGKILATALGGVVGLALGGALGRNFDAEDKKRAERAAQQAACTGESVEWCNESTKSCGTFYPGPVQYGPENRPCRWLECLATGPDGKPEKLRIYAEQQNDGSWITCSPPANPSRYGYSPYPKRQQKQYYRQSSGNPYQAPDGRWYQPQQMQVPYQAQDGRWYVDNPISR